MKDLKIELLEKLVKAQDEYNALLIKEIESMITLAHVHGWKSQYVEAGKSARENIESIKLELSQSWPPSFRE